jgi:hypothetical protein
VYIFQFPAMIFVRMLTLEVFRIPLGYEATPPNGSLDFSDWAPRLCDPSTEAQTRGRSATASKQSEE